MRKDEGAPPGPFATSGGVPLTEELIEQLAAEAEQGYPLEKVRRGRARGRRMPPEASAQDRLAAAHIAADKLCAEMREVVLVVAAWEDQTVKWKHEILENGSVVSQKS